MPPYQYPVCDRRFCVTNGDNRRCTCPNGQPRNERVWKSTVFDGTANASNPDGIDFAWRDTGDEIRRAEEEHLEFVRRIVDLYSTPQYARYQTVTGNAQAIIAKAAAGGAPLAQAAPAPAATPQSDRAAVLLRVARDVSRSMKEGRILMNAPDAPAAVMLILQTELQKSGYVLNESDKNVFASNVQRLFQLP